MFANGWLTFRKGSARISAIIEFGVSRRRAGARAILDGAFPDGFVCSLCMQNAPLSRAEKSLVLASVQGSLDFPIVAKRMRRQFDPCDGPARQDALTATDWDMQSDEKELPNEAPVAYQETKQNRIVSPRGSNKNNGMDRRRTALNHAQGSVTDITGVTVNIILPPSALSGKRGSKVARPVLPQ